MLLGMGLAMAYNVVEEMGEVHTNRNSNKCNSSALTPPMVKPIPWIHSSNVTAKKKDEIVGRQLLAMPLVTTLAQQVGGSRSGGEQGGALIERRMRRGRKAKRVTKTRRFEEPREQEARKSLQWRAAAARGERGHQRRRPRPSYQVNCLFNFTTSFTTIALPLALLLGAPVFLVTTSSAPLLAEPTPACPSSSLLLRPPVERASLPAAHPQSVTPPTSSAPLLAAPTAFERWRGHIIACQEEQANSSDFPVTYAGVC
jgi:hypothetical protein